MVKLVLIIGGMFSAYAISDAVQALAAYQDLILGGLLLLLISPWVTKQFD